MNHKAQTNHNNLFTGFQQLTLDSSPLLNVADPRVQN